MTRHRRSTLVIALLASPFVVLAGSGLRAASPAPIDALRENVQIQESRVEQVRQLRLAGQATLHDILDAQERHAEARLLLVRVGEPEAVAIDVVKSVVRLSVEVLDEINERRDVFSISDRAAMSHRLAEWRVVLHELESGTWKR
ncbi:MAG: hypothetical protein KDA28_09725 [Phycisphaerales bacterium]|nr:hypothetical protein [Phycisphaerales bacterium]